MSIHISYIIALSETCKTGTATVGGKAANLGELFKVEGIHVPDGFCITTSAFKNIIEGNPLINSLLNELSALKLEDKNQVSVLSAKIRNVIESAMIPPDICKEIQRFLSKFGKENAYAIRSSATAEDLPSASFAGQQDSYLNITGEASSVLEHISKCWASLFTERAIYYRMQNHFDHRNVQIAVIVQQMVFPERSGILFTADPVNGNRKITSIDAGFGLGEALVSGLVNADHYTVRNGRITGRKIADKKIAIHAVKNGGIQKTAIEPEQQQQHALTDGQILELEVIGRKVESHFGCPHDIEWCLADDRFYIVQARPVTTLFPIPASGDDENRVYVSVGHQQMMTGAMKPLGISFRQMTSVRPMAVAGGRMFADITAQLASPAGRNMLVNVLGKSDPLIKDALENILEREDFIKIRQDDQPQQASAKNNVGSPPADFTALNDYDATVVGELITSSQQYTTALQQQIQTRSGTALLDFIVEDVRQLSRHISDPKSFGVIMTGMNASSWINEKMLEWLGEKNAADTISQSVPHNVTSEMGLALLDVADAIRPYPEIITYLQQAKADSFLDELEQLKGGRETKNAILDFLRKYGMRCAGEIDITRPRWSEKPATLLPLILGNIKNFEPGESRRKFDRGLQQALQKEKALLERLTALPDGPAKAREAKRMITLVRNLAGYREYPKYDIVSRYYIYKQALLKEAERLVQANVINEKEDIWYLDFDELHEAVHLSAGQPDANNPYRQLINRRKEEYKHYEKLRPPRVITSDGEIITGRYQRGNIPAGAIVGLPVSSGIVEGRARVMVKMEDDILVTVFTDPSWTPLFVAAKGLITEVGGLMTHGAVIAREYGLPAVVGVENATQLIKDGQRIRVNGTEGLVEIL